MRINQFIARATGLSRRAADQAVAQGRVTLNGLSASAGASVTASDIVKLDDQLLTISTKTTTVMLNKPTGYVCSRDGQGSRTIYDLLPKTLHHLKTVGRLDKDSSGLLLLTDDGDLANRLTHPRYGKEKVYQIELDKPLENTDQKSLAEGVKLDDGISRLGLAKSDSQNLVVTMSEGKNRQIRRTFDALGYRVVKLHRTSFGAYKLGDLGAGQFKPIKSLTE